MTSTLTTLTDYCLTIMHQKKFNGVSYFFVVVVVLVVVVVVVNCLLSFVSISFFFSFFGVQHSFPEIVTVFIIYSLRRRK